MGLLILDIKESIANSNLFTLELLSILNHIILLKNDSSHLYSVTERNEQKKTNSSSENEIQFPAIAILYLVVY